MNKEVWKFVKKAGGRRKRILEKSAENRRKEKKTTETTTIRKQMETNALCGERAETFCFFLKSFQK